jgi:hypothetical protein
MAPNQFFTHARGLSLALLVSLTGVLAAQDPAPAHQPADDRESIAFMRWINTVQAKRMSDTGGFAPLSVLAGDRQVPFRGAPVEVTNELGRWHQHRVMLVLSGTGKQYAVKLAPEARCGWTFFTDESGVISKGRPVGCVDTGAPAP